MQDKTSLLTHLDALFTIILLGIFSHMGLSITGIDCVTKGVCYLVIVQLQFLNIQEQEFKDDLFFLSILYSISKECNFTSCSDQNTYLINHFIFLVQGSQRRSCREISNWAMGENAEYPRASISHIASLLPWTNCFKSLKTPSKKKKHLLLELMIKKRTKNLQRVSTSQPLIACKESSYWKLKIKDQRQRFFFLFRKNLLGQGCTKVTTWIGSSIFFPFVEDCHCVVFCTHKKSCTQKMEKRALCQVLYKWATWTWGCACASRNPAVMLVLALVG